MGGRGQGKNRKHRNELSQGVAAALPVIPKTAPPIRESLLLTLNHKPDQAERQLAELADGSSQIRRLSITTERASWSASGIGHLGRILRGQVSLEELDLNAGPFFPGERREELLECLDAPSLSSLRKLRVSGKCYPWSAAEDFEFQFQNLDHLHELRVVFEGSGSGARRESVSVLTVASPTIPTSALASLLRLSAASLRRVECCPLPQPGTGPDPLPQLGPALAGCSALQELTVRVDAAVKTPPPLPALLPLRRLTVRCEGAAGLDRAADALDVEGGFLAAEVALEVGGGTPLALERCLCRVGHRLHSLSLDVTRHENYPARLSYRPQGFVASLSLAFAARSLTLHASEPELLLQHWVQGAPLPPRLTALVVDSSNLLDGDGAARRMLDAHEELVRALRHGLRVVVEPVRRAA